MSFSFSAASEQRLKGVNPDLVKVVKRAIEITTVDFTVLEGLRTAARQKQLLDLGATKTLNSRHLTGHAVDLAPMVGGTVRWDWPLYAKLAKVMEAAAKAEKVPVEWGGSWSSFRDGPHYQLPWSSYPG